MKPTGEKTCGLGRWSVGQLRTLRSCQNYYEQFQENGQGNEKKLRDYMGCKYPPISIFSDSHENEPILSRYPPPILHLLLGKDYS